MNVLKKTETMPAILRCVRQACILIACVTSFTAVANPNGPTVVAGSADVNQFGNTLSINNAPGTIINWQGFSIDRGEITRFLQQTERSAILNRVNGGGISNLLGELTSNGRVFLVNPNGIVIGEDARIDAAGFIGSTLDIRDEDFLSGRYTFKGDGGAIINNGTITAGPEGEVILIATNVENGGDITADRGEIVLAAGREVTLTSLDDADISFRVSAPGDHALNLGSLAAQNGAVRLFANQVMSEGSISANRVSLDAHGQVVLHADSEAEISGTVSATGSDTAGGEIIVLGDTVSLESASLDTTGTSGGRVLIGGEFQGRGDLPRASKTSIDASSVVHADALEQGNGGEIMVWSELETRSFGRLTARGGTISGDGGLIGTSSRGNLEFGQPADVSANAGQPGTWLLEP